MTFEAITDASHPHLATLEPLQNATIAVVGYGNQGRAHALNLRDSGLRVIIGQRAPSASFDAAIEDSFEPMPVADAAAHADLLIVALPDEAHVSVCNEHILSALQDNCTIGFLHGYSVHHRLVEFRESYNVVLVAPKGPGTILRKNYTIGRGIPALVAVHQETDALSEHSAEEIAFAWATGIGCGRCGIIRTTFAEETETDLFGEQAVICGGMMHLITTAFQTLINAGYAPEVAYIETCHELKQVADLIYAQGLSGMADAISNTAEFGMLRADQHMRNSELQTVMRALLADIRSGTFAKEFQQDVDSQDSQLDAYRTQLTESEIETVGRSVRSMMPWLEDA